MMNSFAQSISRLGSFTKDLVASAAGCFLFMPGFRLVTAEDRRAETPSTEQNADKSQERLAGAVVAFFLLSFIASEAVAMIRALGH
jgi:hypothetical protein